YQAVAPAGSSIPAAVRSAVDKLFGAGTPDPAAKEMDGVTVYVASGTKDGAPHQITLSPAGDVQEDSKSINDLPKALFDKVPSKYPGAKFEEIHWRKVNVYTFNVVGPEGKKDTVNYFAAGNRLEAGHMRPPGGPKGEGKRGGGEGKHEGGEKGGEAPKKP